MNITANYGKKRSKLAWYAAITVTVALVVMLLAQLFKYDDFIIIVSTLLPMSGMASAKAIAAGIVLVELMAIPFLLGMYLSIVMRILSATFAVSISIFWLFLSFTNAHASNSGLFSTVIELPGGVLATAWSLLLFSSMVILLREESRASSVPLEKKTKLR